MALKEISDELEKEKEIIKRRSGQIREWAIVLTGIQEDLNEDDDYNDNIDNLKEMSKTYDINAFGIFIENKVLLLQERKVDFQG